MKNWLKNLPGWRTQRKIVVFAVDDYGNVRLDSRRAQQRLASRFGEPESRFDRFDTMETTEDLVALFETLDGVRDKNDHPAVFTPYTVTLNPDFERMREERFERLHLEPLKSTWDKLEARNSGAWGSIIDTWKEGVARGLMQPQFHGGVHFNPERIESRLTANDERLLAALDERSVAMLGPGKDFGPGWTATFGLADLEDEKPRLRELSRDGLEAFQSTFSSSATCFTPPAHEFSPALVTILERSSLKAIDLPLIQHHRGRSGRRRRRFNWTGRRFGKLLQTQVRNVMFEPGGSERATEQALRQIDIAFRCHKPALISSHRVNFCGHIDSKNREHGLGALRKLLEEIIRRWPTVEFMGAADLEKLVSGAHA